MAHLHEMRDSDNHFIIDPATMVITNKSKKHKLQQGDHNSEIYSFEIPRLLEGHDMTLCNLVQIHYINIKADKTEQQSDVYKVTDMVVCDPETDTLVFTWTVHGNATKFDGTLSFRIHFYCIDDHGEYTYKKHTEIFKGISISEGFDNAAAVENDNSDILSQWEARLDALESGGGSVPGDFPAFEKIEGVVEYNEIAKATEVSTVDELLAFDGNAILRDYRHEGSKVTANTSYDVLKIPVQPGDVIRDMLGSYWKSPSNTSPWKYAYFYNANNTIIQNIIIKYAYTGTSTSYTMVDYLELRNNGLTAPDGASFVLLNLFVSYERLVNGSYVSASTLQKCDIVTVNQPAELTAYDGTTALEPYVPQDGPSETYYEAIDDVRIPRYEDALGDIETALDGIIATQESLIGGDVE